MRFAQALALALSRTSPSEAQLSSGVLVVEPPAEGERLVRRARSRRPTTPHVFHPPTHPAAGNVTATVTTAINEDDGDIHLALIGSDGSTLIAEAPEPACTPNARDKAAINKARLVAQDIHAGEKVVAVGVGFYDFAHHQTGHAKNYVELHPLISLRRL